ncbi:hypothetical protein F5Y17DRAFT_427711 [Xylariaceae sp. FL0594]|nr:hypothetical protein F5Y17DRAFT_427711 [Xylariaceae sp. FL0594]
MSAESLHPDEIAHDYVVVIAVESTLTLIALICVLLRFYQQKRNWKLGWDDWTCLGALALCLPLLASTVICATLGHAGYHLWTYTQAELELFCKSSTSTEFFYSGSVALSKLSVLFLYRRIFPPVTRSWQSISSHVLFFLVTAFWLISFFGVLFSYDPVYTQWQLWLPHSNINIKAFYLSTAAIDAVLDIAILTLPQTMVWKVQISRRKRTLVSLVFLLGGFICIASIARLAYLATYNVADITADLSNVYLWTVLEPNLSVICACLPVIYKLFQRKENNSTGGQTSTSSDSYYYSSPYRRRFMGKKQQQYRSSDPLVLDGPCVVIESNGCCDSEPARETVEMGPVVSLDRVHIRRDFTINDAR